MRLGYLVPEWPGQTHAFFWREMARLEAQGVEVQPVSTRAPPKGIRSHTWTEQATQRTAYLVSPKQGALGTAVDLIRAALAFGPSAWARVLRSIANADVGFCGKARLAAISLFGARLARLAEEKRWDHLHVHSCAEAANIGMFASLLSGLPYSLTLHGPLSDYGANQTQKWTHAAFAIVITQKLLDQTRDHFEPEVTSKVHIAPMGVNLDLFKRQRPYEPWNGSGPVQLYSVGRLNPCKGHDDLIKAIRLLNARGVPAYLKIAGEDEAGGTGYHRTLDALIRSLGLEDRVELLGAVSEQTIIRDLSQSHVFALASWAEPLGVAIMEAMALEMPVVVTSGGGVRELVDDRQDGLLVEAHNVESIAAGIEEVLTHPDLAIWLASATRAKIAAGFSDARSADLLIKLIAQRHVPERKQAASAVPGNAGR